MNVPSTPAPSPGPLKRTLRRAAGWGLLALAVHLLILGVIRLTSSETPAETAAPKVDSERVAMGRLDSDEVHEQEIVCEESAIVDEEIADHPETDNDMPFEESFGQSEGLSDAPFEGPANNGTIGLGGGASTGAFGRGARARRGQAAQARVHAARRPFNTEGYSRLRDNPFRSTREHDTSTFSVDVDTASYSNLRRYLTVNGRLPPKDAVRIEEMVNYFPYGYTPPTSELEAPFRWNVRVATCPWQPKHRLARIALKGRTIDNAARPPSNLVFLLDVSGSMSSANKLPLVRRSIKLLSRQLRACDRVAIVVYAGAAGVVLPSTPGNEGETIRAAVDRLGAGGSTNGGAGIRRAYAIAAKHYIEGGVNRVILATDGDFNVGITDHGSLTRLIETKAKTGVYLSVLGFGTGNYKDDRMEALSNIGNGNYAYIDGMREARKVLVEQASGTLVTIAKDVKVQIFFNPTKVAGYRLIGYENRILAKEDFNNDKKDAGDIGAGHAVTALYELVPAGTALPGGGTDPNPFTKTTIRAPQTNPEALFRLRLRYKDPEGQESTLREQDVLDDRCDLAKAPDFRWAAAVASFGMLLRDSPHKGTSSWAGVGELAEDAVGEDPQGYRAEFLRLVRAAQRLSH